MIRRQIDAIKCQISRPVFGTILSNLQHIRDAFENIADRYDHHAALEQEVCRRLLERIAFTRRTPMQILDLGCGTGEGSAGLKRTFRKAQVVALDSSRAMLSHVQQRSSMLRPLRPVCADIGSLPFASRSADLIFSNLASYWCADPMAMFSEFRRVLRPDGMLLFSTLGPATLQELGAAWAGADSEIEMPVFPDLLEIGDALMAAGFREPVMDMERIVLSYTSLDSLLDELEATGMSLLVRGWNREESSICALETAYLQQASGGKLPLGFEINYGIAFGPADGQPVKTRDGDIATFSVDALRSSYRKKP
jgi:malonyl-CoA O-methyltransferase